MLYVHQPYMKPTADNIYLLYKYSPFADLLPDLTIRVMFICYINIPNFQAFCLIYRTKCYIVCVWSTRFCNAMRISKQQCKFVNSSLVHNNKCFWGSWLCKWFLWGLFPCKITCVYFWRPVRNFLVSLFDISNCWCTHCTLWHLYQDYTLTTETWTSMLIGTNGISSQTRIFVDLPFFARLFCFFNTVEVELLTNIVAF